MKMFNKKYEIDTDDLIIACDKNNVIISKEASDVLLLSALTAIVQTLVQNNCIDEDIFKEVWRVANLSDEDIEKEAAEKSKKIEKELEGILENLKKMMEEM